MKNKISNSLKKSFTYIKKHSTNFLLGTIIIVLLLMWCDSSLSHKMWFITAKYKITHPGYRYKSEVIGKSRMNCLLLDTKYTIDKNVIRNREYKFFIFKTHDEIIIPKSEGTNCQCSEIDLSTNKCKWTELEKPIPTSYLLDKDR